MTAAAGPGARRELTAAMGGSALAGALALVSSSQVWVAVTVLRAAPLPATTDRLSGADVAPLVPATGLLLLAGALALLAVRDRGRVVVGGCVLLAGAALLWSGVAALVAGASPGPAELAELVGPGDTGVQTAESPFWPALVALAGLLAVAAGGLVALRGRSWPGPSRRYERDPAAGTAGAVDGTAPAAPHPPTDGQRLPTDGVRPPTDEERAQAAWAALDRGEDPTDDRGSSSS